MYIFPWCFEMYFRLFDPFSSGGDGQRATEARSAKSHGGRPAHGQIGARAPRINIFRDDCLCFRGGDVGPGRGLTQRAGAVVCNLRALASQFCSRCSESAWSIVVRFGFVLGIVSCCLKKLFSFSGIFLRATRTNVLAERTLPVLNNGLDYVSRVREKNSATTKSTC